MSRSRVVSMILYLGVVFRVHAITYYVDAARPDDTGDGQSWENAKHTIQAAVDLAVDDDVILVTNGVYDAGGAVTPGYSLTNRVCITNSIVVRSMNGRHVTIIEGAESAEGGCGMDAVRGVFMTNACSLIGFTVANGYTDAYPREDVFDLSGGGILLTVDCVVSNCTLVGNSADYDGGGAYLLYGGLLTDCTLSNNVSLWSWGGGAYLFEGGTLTHCKLAQNSAPTGDGGGACLDDEGGTLQNCIVTENEADYGGGVSLFYGGLLINCTLSGNEAGSRGGGADFYKGGTADNCVFFSNEGIDHGGGVYMYRGGVLNNCTVSDNSSEVGGGLSLRVGSTVNNSVVWGNTGSSGTDIFVDDTDGALSVSYTCASDGVIAGVDECITNDPCFVNESAGDLRLKPSSLCIDAGSNALAPTNHTPFDLVGNPRVASGTVDMGAYELVPSAADSDVDGLPDWWELQFYGNPTNANSSAVCSNAINTLIEAYVAGFDPLNPTACLELSCSQDALSWGGVSGRVYSVNWTSNMLHEFLPLASNIPWTAGQFTDTVHTNESHRFYRLKVDLE